VSGIRLPMPMRKAFVKTCSWQKISPKPISVRRNHRRGSLFEHMGCEAGINASVVHPC